MNGLPYYQRYPRDFFEGTAGMPLDLKGPYSILIDLMMMMGERGLPDDPHFISGHLGCSVRMWNSIRKRLLNWHLEGPDRTQKIYIEAGIISNFRADNLKIIQSKYRHNQAENARGRNKNKNLEKPPYMPYKDTNTDKRKDRATVATVALRDPPDSPADRGRSDRGEVDISETLEHFTATLAERGEKPKRMGR